MGKDGALSPDDWRNLLAYISVHRTSDQPFDAVHCGITPPGDSKRAMKILSPYAAAGVNWWIEDISPYGYGLGWDKPWSESMVKQLRERIRQGPPRVELE
jgi:hypothetical protein